MNLVRLLLLLICFQIIPGSSGNARIFVTTKLQRSPFGVGVRAALSRSSSYRHVHRSKASTSEARLCRKADPEDEESEDYTRSAAVLRDEARALGVVTLPHLKVRKHSPRDMFGDELEWLEGDATPCVRLSIKRASSSSEEFADSPSVGTAAAVPPTTEARGGGEHPVRPLVFWENMVCGAVSRSMAQTVMHPANTMKTILQSSRGADRPTLAGLMQFDQFRMLTRGAGANFLLSVPHGAVNFAVLEFVRGKLNKVVQTVPFLQERLESIGPALDFTSSAISTICCSVVSTPQMMITDNIMVGNFPNLSSAIKGLYDNGGLIGFYRGWLPGLVGKIPSYVSQHSLATFCVAFQSLTFLFSTRL